MDLSPRETISTHFLYPEHDSVSIDHLKHDLVLWLNYHSFEELPDALEYYLANPHSDLKAHLTLLDLLDQWGVQVQVTICTQVAISRHI